ncbi:MAG: Ig domain-containing protein [Clostridia bacterium]|nr:Ig domain-containing protein [Clostridia bacterium]
MKLSEKKLSLKSIILLTIIIPVLVIAASSVAIVITAKSVQPQETADASLFEEKEYEIKALPKNEEDALTLLSKLFDSAVKGGIVKYDSRTDAIIEEITCENKSVQDFFSFASGSICEKLSSSYEASSIKYGEDASAILSVLPGSAPDEVEAEITDQNILVMKLTYNTVFNNMYFLSDDTAAVKLFTTENAGVFSVVNEKFVPSVFVFTLTADAVKGEMLNFTIDRAYDYSANIAFKNSLSDIGTTPFSMKVQFSETYNFYYAGIDITADVMTLKVGDYTTLGVTPYVEANLQENEYSLSFSSDEKYLTVDENGQITAIENCEEPVEVTITLEYLGKTFTDVCRVYVVTPVETVRISQTSLSMKKGEEHTLSAEIKPDNATIKNVIWMSSDRNTVIVDSTGLVKALKKGTATVKAVSEQGLIVAKCEITVTD